MLLFKYKKLIPTFFDSKDNALWDTKLQLWVDGITKKPLVSNFTKRNATNYGETVLTTSMEGIDQSESSLGTNYGETVLTKTHEGTDQSEGSHFMSNYGETILTRTSEGADQSESSDNHVVNNHK